MNKTKLGCNQFACLDSLIRHGAWPGGWVWDNRSGTIRILDSLVKRGMAETYVPEPGKATHYRATDAGRTYWAGTRRGRAFLARQAGEGKV